MKDKFFLWLQERIKCRTKSAALQYLRQSSLKKQVFSGKVGLQKVHLFEDEHEGERAGSLSPSPTNC